MAKINEGGSYEIKNGKPVLRERTQEREPKPTPADAGAPPTEVPKNPEPEQE